MSGKIFGREISSFQYIILGFMGLILLGAFILMLPISSKSGIWTPFDEALFTSTSATCVTGLIVQDTASYWSDFGQGIILVLIQIGGLGVVSVAALIATISGRKISLLQRSMLQDTISAHQIGGIVKLTSFIFKAVLVIEVLGAAVLLPSFCSEYGVRGMWMAFFHSVSAFCNAGFDVMGDKTGQFSSLSAFAGSPGVVIPVCLLIIIGGIGFLTWDDIVLHRHHFKKYRMQSKVILTTSALLIIIPAIVFFFTDFAGEPMKERLCLSIFQAVTPRTAGFNTADLSQMTRAGRAIIVILMIIGGSPGSTAGGMKTTTVAVLFSNAGAVFRKKKNAHLFGRRIEDGVIKYAATLLTMYLFLSISSAIIISGIEGLPLDKSLFETASAVGTVGLSLGLTPGLGLASHLILIVLMFIGRVGGLTLIYAALSSKGGSVSERPVEKIIVG